MSSAEQHRRIDDPDRLDLVRQLLREDAPLRGALDRITEVVSTALRAPVALVSIVDDRRQSFLSCVGLPPAIASGTPISHSFCQHVVDRDAPLIVGDAREDVLVADNPSVAELKVIAYAGIPLRVDGHVVGSLCAIDHVPREWAALEIDTLRATAALVEYLVGTRTAHVSRSAEAARAADLATRMQQALLAQPDPGTFRVDLTYQAGSRRLLLGGDFVATRLAGDGSLDFVIGDVSGHGPEAAALAVEIRASWHALRTYGISIPDLFQSLDRIVSATEFVVTMLVGNLEAGGRLTIGTAGHPPPLVVGPDGARELDLPPQSLLGVAGHGGSVWRTVTADLGDATLFAYTDGLVEGRADPAPARYGVERLLAAIRAHGPVPAELIEQASHAHGGPLPDDVAILLIGCGAARA